MRALNLPSAEGSFTAYGSAQTEFYIAPFLCHNWMMFYLCVCFDSLYLFLYSLINVNNIKLLTLNVIDDALSPWLVN